MRLPDCRHTITLHLSTLELRQLQEVALRAEHDPTVWEDLERVAHHSLTIALKHALQTGFIPGKRTVKVKVR